LQAKLLRVVQYGEFEQVGSSFTRRVNVRIIAATHRDLKKEVAAGKFREDLYYRLHVFPLYLPPLRERGNDILLLAEAFLAKYAARYGRPQPTLSEADKQQLLHYHWPGNVRELQNIMERAVITSREGSIQLTGITASEASSTHNPAMPEKILTAAQLEQLERENMERALRATKGKVFGADGAAALIGIPPTTLSSRMKKLGIHLNRFK
jgi:formate hydrogenlyase transcriptional activator